MEICTACCRSLSVAVGSSWHQRIRACSGITRHPCPIAAHGFMANLRESVAKFLRVSLGGGKTEGVHSRR